MPANAESPPPRAAGFRPADARWQLLLILSTLSCSWLGMQWVHEAGHVVGALATGGEVQRVVLHPLSSSRTDLKHNPRPLLVTWAGPLIGVLAPVAAWLTVHALRLATAYLFRFFAGFCCVANGAYIGLGSFAAIGDCGDLLNHGAPVCQLWLFGILASATGFVLWNRLGSHFGLGPTARPIRVAHSLALAALTLSLATAGALIPR